MLIGITGHSGAQKSEVCKHLCKAHGFTRLHAGTPVKKAVRTLAGLTKAQTEGKLRDNPTIACNAAAGSVVSAMSVTGGDGNPATFSATGGDTSDFAVNGVDVVVGTNGIAAANCGKTMTLTITANQP